MENAYNFIKITFLGLILGVLIVFLLHFNDWLDDMNNAAWTYLGGGSNSAVVIMPDGRVMARTGWYDSERLQAAIDCMRLLE